MRLLPSVWMCTRAMSWVRWMMGRESRAHKSHFVRMSYFGALGAPFLWQWSVDIFGTLSNFFSRLPSCPVNRGLDPFLSKGTRHAPDTRTLPRELLPTHARVPFSEPERQVESVAPDGGHVAPRGEFHAHDGARRGPFAGRDADGRSVQQRRAWSDGRHDGHDLLGHGRQHHQRRRDVVDDHGQPAVLAGPVRAWQRLDHDQLE
jgi:hypothetical protein